jgi:hypothetical protein
MAAGMSPGSSVRGAEVALSLPLRIVAVAIQRQFLEETIRKPDIFIKSRALSR